MPSSKVGFTSSPPASPRLGPTAADLDRILSLIARDTDLLMGNLLGELKDVVDVDELEARAVEGAGMVTDFQRAAAKEVFRRRRAQLEAGRVKKMKTELRKKTKRGAVGMGDGKEILEGVVGAKEVDDAACDERALGVNYKSFMDWQVSIVEALQLTFVSMSKMLGMVVLFGAVAWANVVTTASLVSGAEFNSTNFTGLEAEVGEEGEDEEGKGEVTRTTASVLLVSALAGAVMVFAAAQACFNMKLLRSYVLLWLPPIGALACLWAYFELGGTHVSGTALGATYVVTSAGCGGVFGFSIISEVETVDLDTFALSKAAQRAAHVLGGGEGEMKKRGVLKRAKLGLIIALPILFNLAVLLLLVLGILTLFQLYEGIEWKIFVTALALGIKIGGNKALLGLIGSFPMWGIDCELYTYEYSTALIVRILQLSLPDENTAMLIGLAGAVVEVGTRIFFYMLFLKKGLANPLMTDEEKKKYAKRGKLRVQDASNDMVVEYMSSIVAGLFMIHLAPTGVFSFATTAEISTNTIIKLCAFQIVPELFLDFYVTFMEIYGGLKDLHVSYWKSDTGADKDSKHWVNRLGDLPKATLCKMAQTWAMTAFVVATCLK
ncbi:hypothetical protein TeGR_g7725 [Tetraparma gracilis]|uniref:Uncharacterized protein n=1 Tax=Tetraparma gracilis TaxID=2962635 RepID=A0ABQ6N5Z8_9STRA|nr:hypothetical protein TeGR_g7725 [Tetraparma gracilis]